jgi:hypothetical protein
METLVGFAFGFWLGTKEGKDGVAKIVESWKAIRESTELKNLVGGAIGVVVPIISEIKSSGTHAIGSKAA